MIEPFDRILDPRAGLEPAPSASPSRPADEAPPLGRGIPEVTRPRGRLALPAMILGATLVTGGFVYSVSSAQPASPADVAGPAVPPPAPVPTLTPPGVEPATADSPGPGVAPRRQPVAVSGAGADLVRQRQMEARRRAEERLRSPLIVSGGPTASGAFGDTVRLAASSSSSDPNSAFLALASDRATPTARARVLPNQAALIAQGALVAGVLETAINSDLPGMLRAVVAADVTSFDGRHVLIPRGSRLIGEYRSGIAIGQSRAFVVWTRLITPAGVSIELGSPGTDALGQAGLTGRVDEHFFQRFGAALLLSVVGSAGQVAANAASSGDTLTINAASDASRVAELALQNRVNILPTIKVRQGTPIRIFVARDLDFTGTETASSAASPGGG